MTISEIVTVSDARAELTATLKRFRSSKTPAPVVFGSHRRAEAVIVPYELYARQTGAASASVRELVHSRAALIERFATLNSLSHVRVFGSVARGEETATSDLDLLVTPDESASTFDLAQFASDVELVVGRTVDVVSDRALDPTRDARVLREAVPL